MEVIHAISRHSRVLGVAPGVPLADRVEMGVSAVRAICDRYETRYDPAISNHIFGVSVFVSEDMEPRAWRTLDADGNVIEEGMID